ncbi:MAG: HEAT repeat domain-containing protein [Planctomycetes bacterium]|nr:HEAT repeat domain-containing protein [Planctomycetota bacterium]
MLIYKSQTACYADDREDAVDRLGDFDCDCYPEVLVALIYALNDTDEEVRAEAADELGDMIEDGRCCCNDKLVAALTCALADCDSDVRDEAEEALELCGYEIVDGCCGGCGACGCTGEVMPAMPQMMDESLPVPAPPVPGEDQEIVPPAEPKEAEPRRTSIEEDGVEVGADVLEQGLDGADVIEIRDSEVDGLEREYIDASEPVPVPEDQAIVEVPEPEPVKPRHIGRLLDIFRRR